MKAQIRQMILYHSLCEEKEASGMQTMSGWYREYEQAGRLPAKDKREGKRILEELTSTCVIIHGFPIFMWNAASAIIRVQNRSFCGFHRHRLWRLNITRMYLTGMGRTVSGSIRHRLSFWQKKTDHFFYEGAPVCQDFGNTNFITVPQ